MESFKTKDLSKFACLTHENSNVAIFPVNEKRYFQHFFKQKRFYEANLIDI